MVDKLLFKLAGIKQIMVKLAGLTFLQALLIIGQALFLSATLTNLWLGKSLSSQVVNIVGFSLCFLFRQGIDLLNSKILDDYARKSAKDMRKKLLEKLFVLGPEVVQQQGTGNLVTLTLDGIFQVENYIKLLLSKMIGMLLIPVLILIVAFWMDLTSGIIMLLVYPLIVLFMIILGFAAKAKADQQFTTFQRLSNHFIDSLRGIDTLKYFGLSRRYSRSVYRSSENFRKSTMQTLRVAMLSTFALDFFTTLSIAVLAVFLGLRLIDQEMALFYALSILILAPEYFLPIRNFANDYHATLNGKNSFHAIAELIHSPAPKKEEVELTLWQNKDQFQLNDVSFAYDEQNKLAPLSFAASGYQKVGIIGMSGSGKTTLINLISGFFTPNSGTFKVQGHELADLNAAAWRKQVLYIPQTPYVFSDTLRNNIAFYTPDVSDEKIWQAIKVVGLEKLVAELPDGLETQIGSGKRALSGGQAQRIALARAFLDQKRKIMIFDEPTAHLDIETELELKEKMMPLMENKLVFFATHRLHWMHQMDHILVMDEGRLVEQGTYAELLAKNGYFCKLLKEMRGTKDAE
ncbi:thiol reductant ABC exporter subunit CydD [Ligilactobacillus apodemi]|uniref:ABC transporter n=1 Tax=Ligilactobacillus apodemi DSM 16634 = JCM 16172 TaxID=1423724 RepID=A0A0R1U2I0_9LACO|nr:thiol reductant ABC exporter subunit CydD [Ligilactobacillus apodemi]KRL85674.1 ABC transporter [Ligilactobacillus apodemi DSM 16634 = JCM 16172]MCR1901004.1 thiol reductant ABC exporter subunit CydD [Ligilactobacillus apodemi]